jgi:ribosomal protein S18 acetylase RimI-like enzyme
LLIPNVLAAHRARLLALDPVLAETRPLPEQIEGDVLLSCSGGEGLVRTSHVDQDSFMASFTASREFRLIARVDGPKALGELLDQWQRLDGFRPGPDDTAMITWPSRDTAMARLFIERGFTPQVSLAVRKAGHPIAAKPTDAVVRRAVADDMEAVVALWMEEARWDHQFNGSVLRASTERAIRDDARMIVEPDGLWCWVAERDGDVVAIMVVQPPARAEWAASAVPVSPATYLTCGIVSSKSRGDGVGTTLVREVHDFLDERGVALSLLHYAALNPLSVPFWSRCGYRPLTTAWARGTVG